MNLAKATLQFLGHSQVNGESISGKLVVARKDCKEERQDLINWCPQRLEKEHQRNDGGSRTAGISESKSCIQVFRSKRQAEEVEGGTRVELRNHKVGQGMAQFPMSQFVTL